MWGLMPEQLGIFLRCLSSSPAALCRPSLLLQWYKFIFSSCISPAAPAWHVVNLVSRHNLLLRGCTARTSGRLKAHGSEFYSRSDDRGQNGLWSRDGGIHWKQQVFPKQRGRNRERKRRGWQRERGGRIWEQAGRATELMKNEWETWIRGGVDGEMRYFEGASVRWEAAHNNSITLNRFPSNAAWALKHSRHKWLQIVFTSSWNSRIPTATLSPKLSLGVSLQRWVANSPQLSCMAAEWWAHLKIYQLTKDWSNVKCSTIILRKFRLAGSIWINLSWPLKFKFKTNPKYFTSISRLWDQPFLIFSAPTGFSGGQVDILDIT